MNLKSGFYHRNYELFLFLILGGFFFNSAALDDYLAEYHLSCFKSTDVNKGDLDFCQLVHWKSASIFEIPLEKFNIYDPGSSMTRSAQDKLASEFASLTINPKSNSEECKQAIKRFACVTLFPLCPEEATSLSSYSYYPACKLQCEQVMLV